MTKPIKIDKANAAAIEERLASVNGKASRHTFTTYGEVWRQAEDAEKVLESLSISKAARSGARYVAQSGSNLPNAYKYAAKASVVTLERRSSAWWLVGVVTYDLHPKHTPTRYVHLTAEQDETAVAALRKRYVVQKRETP